METNLYPPHRMENTIKIDSATRVPNSRAKTRFARRTRWRRRHRWYGVGFFTGEMELSLMHKLYRDTFVCILYIYRSSLLWDNGKCCFVLFMLRLYVFLGVKLNVCLILIWGWQLSYSWKSKLKKTIAHKSVLFAFTSFASECWKKRTDTKQRQLYHHTTIKKSSKTKDSSAKSIIRFESSFIAIWFSV